MLPVTTHVSVRHLYTRAKVEVVILGIVTVEQKNAWDHHTCLERTRSIEDCSPRERESQCEVQDDMPNLVILKVKSMTKRADSPRVLVDSGVSNNFVRQQSLPLLDFEERHKRVIRARFSYKHRLFVEERLVLDLGDKFDIVSGMPWLARHDPIIDWEKRTVVRFGHRGATDTPNGASEPPSETVARAAVSGHTTWSARAVTTSGCRQKRSVWSGTRHYQ
ncbi:reverse transcriptase [Phytophthora megakarya]|uniref:Reverse transcriptase n=1 Tax=Phytophthora megakarya TaxID=4795 RepID=A0A225UD38_9STRA|nr:reverse transcriptase [Phytophthora megakarya]